MPIIQDIKIKIMMVLSTKYFAKSLAILNVVKLPRVINNCLPIANYLINFVGEESKSTMLPASLAA